MATDSGATLGAAESATTRALNQAFAQYLTRARTQVLGASDTAPAPTRWPGMTLWQQLVAEFVMPVIETVFGEAFAAAARSDLLQVATYREQYMATARNRLSESLWPDISHDRLRRTLAQGVEAGEAVSELRERAAQALSVDTNSYLAERIARTEAHTAVEGGTYSANLAWADATGEELYQRWQATNDSRTRDTHRAAHGQTVRLGTPFRVGGYTVAFPGDPTIPAEESIHCRCTTLTGTLAELDDIPVTVIQGSGMSEILAEAVPSTPPVVHWRGVLAPLGVRGDHRILEAPATPEVPTTAHMWLSYQERSAEGHDGKVAVGRIDRVWQEGGDLWGEGVFDMADETGIAQSVARKVTDGFAGTVSIDQNDLVDATLEMGWYDRNDEPTTPPVDPDEAEAAIMRGDLRELWRISNWRLAGATLVQDPAFATSRNGRATAFIEVYDPQAEEAALAQAITAAAVGDLDLPLAERDQDWDASAALERLAEQGLLGAGTLWRSEDADADSTDPGDYMLPFADLIGEQLHAIPQGVFAAAATLQQGVDLPAQAQDALRSRVGALYARMAEAFDDPDLVTPWDSEDAPDDERDDDEEMALTASADLTWPERVARAVPAAPPESWFRDPQLTGVTKVRITDEGRVYGHIADWSQRHIGFTGELIYPPRCPEGGAYPRFHRAPVRTAEGTRVNTGPLTTAGHADTTKGVTMSAAMAHYDDPRFVLANVVTGEDKHGIWVAGALRPGVEPWQVAFGDTYAFSGDWRFGHLVAACSVSVGGFHVPNDDSVHALAASAGISPQAAQYRQVLRDGQTVALLSAGVLAPSRQDQARSVHARIFAELSNTRQSLEGQLSGFADQVADRLSNTLHSALLEALRTHAAQEREFAQVAVEINAGVQDEAAQMAAQMADLAENGEVV